MRYTLKIIVGMLLMLVSVFVLISLSNHAQAADCTWAQTSGALASTNGNWANGSAPDTGDNVYFLSGNAACTFDIAKTFGKFEVAGTYGATITFSQSIGCSYWLQSASGSTVTGNTAKKITDSGDFTHTAGTITDTTVRVIMTGTGKTMSIASTASLYDVQISGNTTWVSSVAGGGRFLIVDSGKTLTITSPNIFYLYPGGGTGTDFANSGTISGTGILRIGLGTTGMTGITFGTCNVNLEVLERSNGAASKILTLATNTIIGGTVYVYSNHGTYTATLELNNYNFQCTGLTIGTRGILKADGTETINCSGDWDSSAGTWAPASSQNNMTGAYKSIKLGATQTFYDLQLANYNYNVTGAAPVSNVLRVVGLTPGERYSWLYGTTFISHKHLADILGYVNLTAQTLAVHNLYHMDQCPTISSTPILSAIIGHQYSYDCNASEAGTWSLSSSYADLDIDANGVVSGFLSTNGLSPAGDSITVNITFTDSVGNTAYDNYTITVGGVQEDIIPVATGLVGVVIIIGLTTVAIGAMRRRTK